MKDTISRSVYSTTKGKYQYRKQFAVESIITCSDSHPKVFFFFCKDNSLRCFFFRVIEHIEDFIIPPSPFSFFLLLWRIGSVQKIFPSSPPFLYSIVPLSRWPNTCNSDYQTYNYLNISKTALMRLLTSIYVFPLPLPFGWKENRYAHLLQLTNWDALSILEFGDFWLCGYKCTYRGYLWCP